MKKKKVQNHQQRNPMPAILISLCLVLGVMSWLIFRQGNIQNTRPIELQPQAKCQKIHREHTTEELNSFWKTHIEPVANNLFQGKYDIPEIGERASFLYKKITERYHGHTLAVDLFLTRNPESAQVLQGSAVIGGSPKIAIFVPSQMDIYDNIMFQEGSKGEELFRTGIVVGLLHEMDHLVFGGDFKHGLDKKKSFDQFFEEERIAWAQTSEHVLSVLVKKGVRLDQSSANYYKIWAEGGSNPNSEYWRNKLRGHYWKALSPH